MTIFANFPRPGENDPYGELEGASCLLAFLETGLPVWDSKHTTCLKEPKEPEEEGTPRRHFLGVRINFF